MIYLNSRNLENTGSVREELAKLREVAGSPCQSSGGDFRIFRCSTRRTPRNDTTPTNGLVLELRRREGRRQFPLMDVIGEIVELILNLPEMAPSLMVWSVSQSG